jgi:redox-sensitive bicupin YhaK (pirin superfamily)
MQAKQIQAHLQLQTHTHSSGFRSAGLNHRQLNLDPILNIDLFHMSQPTFPPHPHAGFSAVTYLLPESLGSFQNRDSLGDQSLILPGSVHWTQAGSGVMHEEIPTVPGVDAWGFQIFVNLNPDAQLKPPKIFHADPAEIPILEYETGKVRVIAGSFQGRASHLNQLDTPVDFLDVQVDPHQTLLLPLEHPYAYFAFGIAGTGSLAEREFGAHQVATLSRDGDGVILRAQAEGLRLLIGGGEPLQQAVYWDGPFAMSRQDDTQKARQRFIKGDMGRLSPSF